MIQKITINSIYCRLIHKSELIIKNEKISTQFVDGSIITILNIFVYLRVSFVSNIFL